MATDLFSRICAEAREGFREYYGHDNRLDYLSESDDELIQPRMDRLCPTVVCVCFASVVHQIGVIFFLAVFLIMRTLLNRVDTCNYM
jgi:hypothetical protein